MGAIPGWLLRHTITVRALTASGAYEDEFADPVSVRCFLDQQTKVVRSPIGDDTTSSSTAYCPLGTVAPPGSRVVLPDGRETVVINALRRDGGGLPTPDHLEVQME
ncbi:hypothetical protein RM780_04010 [Streptomyces sp. DSM 44917]|uniref:Head-to-tail stopper n=1 Tax=Streptomyces boetiae TaxID=3075541 RepID=A0ABU2L436_9ACTN|nr:hypothetical protein [Streptomyces sp. DSM 44917]MDT0306127.1 hypothetical protein [Streptomyces sp. DSM 44917]